MINSKRMHALFIYICTMPVISYAMVTCQASPFRLAVSSFLERASQSTKNSMLFGVSLSGDVNSAGHLIWNGAEVNVRYPESFNMTPLIAATVAGHISMVRYLLCFDADANLAADRGKTALLFAVQKNNPELVRLLLEHRAIINCRHADTEKNIFGSGSETTIVEKITPLMAASVGGHEKIAEVLLAHGAHILAKDSRNWTPLQYAVRAQKNETTHLLATFLMQSHLVRPIERKTELEKANSLLESMRTSPKGMFLVTFNDNLYNELKRFLTI